jgi:hypothetical protein
MRLLTTVLALIVTSSLFGQNNDSINIPDSAIIHFADFDVILSEYAWGNSESTVDIVTDTINIAEGMGFDLDNRLLKINSKSIEDKFEVFAAFETDLRVYVGEKELKDLADWHTKEPFIKIADSAHFYYRLPPYNRDERVKEISKDLDEIKEAVLKIEGEYIDSSLVSITEFKKLPVTLWISKVYIQINHFDANGNKKTFIIINQSSWGC